MLQFTLVEWVTGRRFSRISYGRHTIVASRGIQVTVISFSVTFAVKFPINYRTLFCYIQLLHPEEFKWCYCLFCNCRVSSFSGTFAVKSLLKYRTLYSDIIYLITPFLPMPFPVMLSFLSCQKTAKGQIELSLSRTRRGVLSWRDRATSAYDCGIGTTGM